MAVPRSYEDLVTCAFCPAVTEEFQPALPRPRGEHGTSSSTAFDLLCHFAAELSKDPLREWLILEAFISFRMFRSRAPSKIITKTTKGSVLTAKRNVKTSTPLKVWFEICPEMILESEETFFFLFFFLSWNEKKTDL